MSFANYNPEERQLMLDLARASIQHGLENGDALKVNPDDYPEALRQQRATFVTLNENGDLRGCIGTLEAYQPLISDVAEHAWAAAFQDPRFGILHCPTKVLYTFLVPTLGWVRS